MYPQTYHESSMRYCAEHYQYTNMQNLVLLLWRLSIDITPPVSGRNLKLMVLRGGVKQGPFFRKGGKRLELNMFSLQGYHSSG